MSKGNGHPYSWSAIFNGYDMEAMQQCGFPVIPDYLSKQRYPEDFISNAQVSHIWTQSLEQSKHIAKASRIEHVVARPEEMIGQIDGVLLARDDAENHLEFARPFLKAGLPVYIDKPMALSVSDAEALFALEQYPGQIFSCSALRFASELLLSDQDRIDIGEISHVTGLVPNSWDKYIIHAIDPILENLGPQGNIEKYSCIKSQDRTAVSLRWESGVTCNLTSLGALPTGIEIQFFGRAGSKKLVFRDSFSAFKKALVRFVDDSVEHPKSHRDRIMAAIDVVEKGALNNYESK
ncbi:Gfo/Idh/MocA family oxidoreductase [Ferrigenium kumadai]|nr:Gfo/Idh/MocA family oxidoreductase [Ferrigenium kumadai]